jgi:hypothetical protein
MLRRRPAVTGAALGGAFVLAYLILWFEATPSQISRIDFTNTYVGATLFREGLGASMYNLALQAGLYARVVGTANGRYLPFDAAPLAAVMAAPVTLLGLDTAYRVWSLLQFGLIAAAVVVAVRASSGEVPVERDRRVAVGLIALACMGTCSTLLEGQLDGVAALGLAVFYALLKRRRMGAAGAVLAVSSLLAKPHLALGLAAFALAWRDRRLILGMLAGGAATLALSLLAVGAGGIAGFLGDLGSQVAPWPLASMVSLIGIAGSFLGQTSAAHVAGAVGSLAAMAVAATLGAAVRSRPQRLEAALAGATVLSLLASPHAYVDDVALLVPAAAWSLTALATRADDVRPLRNAVLAVWAAISVAAYLLVTGEVPLLSGLTPWTLIAAAGLAIAVCQRQGAGTPEVGPDPEPGLRPAAPEHAGGSLAISP